MIERNNIIVAIDGYSSCGKSTLAKQLADFFSYLYIDTGAMYRCVTLYFIENSINIEDTDAVNLALDKVTITFCRHEYDQCVYLNDKDVTDQIRTPEVSGLVSEVAAISEVRRKLVEQQRLFGKQQDLIMDGRDIGTVVFPDANLKIFLTASEMVRAKRRFTELQEKNIEISFEEVLANLAKRDHIDSTRDDSPLKKAKDAIVIDNTEMSRSEQFEKACRLIETIKVS